MESLHVFFILVTVGVVFIDCKVYDKCELARELREIHALPEHEIATWVCIAKHESAFNTSAVNLASGDHGLFQISDIYWCSPPGKGFACNVPCAALEDDDITDDVVCIRRIFNEHKAISGNGFNAWVVYPLYCKGDLSHYVEGCFDKNVTNNIIDSSNTTDEDNDGDIYEFPPLPTYKPIKVVPPTTRASIVSYPFDFDEELYSFPHVTPTTTQAYDDVYNFQELPTTLKPSSASSTKKTPMASIFQRYFATSTPKNSFSTFPSIKSTIKQIIKSSTIKSFISTKPPIFGKEDHPKKSGSREHLNVVHTQRVFGKTVVTESSKKNSQTSDQKFIGANIEYLFSRSGTGFRLIRNS